MSWWLELDAAVFRFVNGTLNHPALEPVMRFFAWNSFFVPVLLVLAAWLLWKGGTRGRLMVAVAILVIGLGDALVINTIKHAVGRPRPFLTLEHVNLLVGKGRSGSMPSSHASTWFAAALIGFVYYRRSWRILLPIALTMAFSRVYVGVHYPSDVLAGAILGMGYAAAGIWTLQRLWLGPGREWFPSLWARLPSLIPTAPEGTPMQRPERTPVNDQEWLRLGYLVIFISLMARLVYLGSGEIELSEDEAYQWVWSKHLALSYYSKPPLIAYTQWLGTSLWGDTEFGVRFFSPVLGAATALLLLRFTARQISARAAFLLMLVLLTTPLLGVGATVMTVDPLLVFFWTGAMVAGWRAIQPDGALRHWLIVGVCLGFGLLSKYTALFQLACFAIFFASWPPARKHLRTPGPYVALVIVALSFLPMLIWNAQHGWITVEHVAMGNAGLGKPWTPTLRYLGEFIGAEAGLLNPIYFVGAVWAGIAFWKRYRGQAFPLFCFCMGAPVFLGYLLFSLHTRILPNWIAPAVLPLFCLMAFYWYGRWQAGVRAVPRWLTAGVALGGFVVVILHDTDLVAKIASRPLPPKVDPLRRVRSWTETARVVDAARQDLQREGKETFIIGGHYGITGQLSFYLKEAKARIKDTPLVYYRTSDRPKNQFFFWPGYRQRIGQNAIYADDTRRQRPAPDQLLKEFESVTDLGLHEIKYRGRVMRTVQLFVCRNLRPSHAVAEPNHLTRQ